MRFIGLAESKPGMSLFEGTTLGLAKHGDLYVVGPITGILSHMYDGNLYNSYKAVLEDFTITKMKHKDTKKIAYEKIKDLPDIVEFGMGATKLKMSTVEMKKRLKS